MHSMMAFLARRLEAFFLAMMTFFFLMFSDVHTHCSLKFLLTCFLALAFGSRAEQNREQ